MTPEELMALLSTSTAGIRGAENATLAQARTPLALLEAGNTRPVYQLPLARAGGDQQYIYPGFGVDPERQAAAGGNPVPPGGTPTPTAPVTTPSPTDINKLIADLTKPTTPTTPGGSSNNALGTGALALPILGLLLKAAPWLAKQLAGVGADPDSAANTTDLLPPSEEPMAQVDEGTDAPPEGDQGQGQDTQPATGGGDFIDHEGAWNTTDLLPPSQEPPAALDEAAIPDWAGEGSLNVADNVIGGGGLDSFGPPGGVGEWAGTGADVGSDLASGLRGIGEASGLMPSDLGIPDLSFDPGLGITIDPLNIGAGALGSYVGGRLASATARGDEQQGWASKGGGLVGGAIGSAILPGIGTLIGSLLGSYGAGYLGAGEPDDPFTAGEGKIAYTENGPVFSYGGSYASNGADPRQASSLDAWLNAEIARRAAAEGLTVNPEMVNRRGFFAGYDNRPGYSDPLYLRWDDGTGGAKPDEANLRARDDAAGRAALADEAWNGLKGRSFFVRPNTTASWDTVNAQLKADPGKIGADQNVKTGEGYDVTIPGTPIEQRTYDNTPRWDGGAPKITQDGVQGYYTQENVSSGEGGETYRDVFNAGAPPPPPEATPPPEQTYYQPTGGESSGREGGLIPPTPGGTRPVPNFTAHTGEFVIRPEAVQQFGPEMLTAINRGTFPQMPEPGETDMVEGAENVMMMGEDGDGLDGDEGDDMDASDPWTRPYADADAGPSPFERVTAGEDPMQRMRDLPPEVQQAMLSLLGADPLVASAWLRVLGPEYQQVVAQALKAAGAMKQQQATAAMGGGMGMAPGAPPPPGAGPMM